MSMDSCLLSRLFAALAVAGSLLTWSPFAAAEVYKWVDEKGVTNYAASPPVKVKANTVDLQSTRVSVYSPPPEHQTSRALERMMLEKTARLEEELKAERRANRVREASAQAEIDQRQLAYEQCVRDRRVDCDEVRDGSYASPYYYPYATPLYLTAWRRRPLSPAHPAHPIARPRPPSGLMSPPPGGGATRSHSGRGGLAR